MDETREEKQNLWTLAASPVIWSMHFLLCYTTAAVWCGKIPNAPFAMLRLTILIYTLVALGLITLIGTSGYKRHRYGGGETVPHDFDTREDRHRFLGFATLLLSLLSAVGTIFTGLVLVFIRNCN